MKILHAADLHLKADLASPEGGRRFEAFQELCAKAKAVDVLILAGDLFHSWNDAKDAALLAKVKAELQALGRLPVIIIPGNHEFLGGDGRHPYDPLPDLGRETRLVKQTPFAAITIGKVEFLAFPFQEGKTSAELFATLPPPAPGVWRVGILHGTVSDRPQLRMSAYGKEDAEAGGELLIQDRDLQAAGFRYAALGHIHKKDEWRLPGGALAAYPGSACAVRRTEDQGHGCNIVELDEENGQARLSWVELKTAARAERRAFIVLPGAEAAAIESVRAWLQDLDRGLWPVAKLSGLGDTGALHAGIRRLEADFKDAFKLPPDISLEVAAFDAGSGAAGSPLVQDFFAALRAQAGAVAPELLARAMLLGWFALSLNEKKAEDALRKALEARP
jgi:hypothetical protein